MLPAVLLVVTQATALQDHVTPPGQHAKNSLLTNMTSSASKICDRTLSDLGKLSILALVLIAVLTGCSTALEQLHVRNIVAVDLSEVPARRSELSGHWLEFQAYLLPHGQGDLLIAVPGQRVVSSHGDSAALCRGTAETNLPVVLTRGIGSIRRRELLSNPSRYRRARISAKFTNETYSVQGPALLEEFPGYFQSASILEVYDQWCDL